MIKYNLFYSDIRSLKKTFININKTKLEQLKRLLDHTKINILSRRFTCNGWREDKSYNGFIIQNKQNDVLFIYGRRLRIKVRNSELKKVGYFKYLVIVQGKSRLEFPRPKKHLIEKYPS